MTLAFVSYFAANLFFDFLIVILLAVLCINTRPWMLVLVLVFWIIPLLFPLPPEAYGETPEAKYEKIKNEPRSAGTQIDPGMVPSNVQGLVGAMGDLKNKADGMIAASQSVLKNTGLQVPEGVTNALPPGLVEALPENVRNNIPNAVDMVNSGQLGDAGTPQMPTAPAAATPAPDVSEKPPKQERPRSFSELNIIEQFQKYGFAETFSRRFYMVQRPPTENVKQMTMNPVDALRDQDAMWFYLRIFQMIAVLVMFAISRPLGTVMLGLMAIPMHYYIAAIGFYFGDRNAQQSWFTISLVLFGLMVLVGLVMFASRMYLKIANMPNLRGFPSPETHLIKIGDDISEYQIDGNKLVLPYLTLNLDKAGYDEKNPMLFYLRGGSVVEFIPKGTGPSA